MNEQQIAQIIEYLSQLANPEQLCIYREICMTKSEWASWVQAIGSIAAILASVYLVYRQMHESESIRNVSAANQVENFHKGMHLIANPIAKMDVSISSLNTDAFELAINQLEELMTIARSIAAENLSKKWSYCLQGSRFICASCIQELKRVNGLAATSDLDPKKFDEKEQLSILKTNLQNNLYQLGEIKKEMDKHPSHPTKAKKPF